jgi:hypothetical protein
MMDNAGNWTWLLIFFLLWAVATPLWFAFVSVPKRMCGHRLGKMLDCAAVALSACSVLAALMALNCESYIQLPFTENGCQISDLEQIIGTSF